MNNHAHDVKRGECLAPTDLKLLGNPLEFIHEDHLREREICSEIDALAQLGSPGTEMANHVVMFLENELPLHLEDEEEDLFPLLKQRCEKEDEIDKAIQRLTSDHKHANEDTPKVLDILKMISSDDRGLSENERRTLNRYATHARRHLILENAIILPFAKLRLTEDDLESLSLRMMQRRGLDGLVETENVE